MARRMDEGDGTRCVHGGHAVHGSVGDPLHPGPVLSTAVPPRAPAEPTPADYYGRAGNPTWRALEAAIGDARRRRVRRLRLRDGRDPAVLRAAPRPGGALVLPSDGYYLARSLRARRAGAARASRCARCPTAGDWPAGTLDGAALGPAGDPVQPRARGRATSPRPPRAAHAAGALLAVDNTTATPLGQRPLELGADLVVATDTKALAGHGDVVLGHVSTARPRAGRAAARTARTRGGAVPGPMEAWLAHRGLGTLDLRLARQAPNAAALAVSAARAPRGRPTSAGPACPTIRRTPSRPRQMRRWNGVLRFTLPSVEAVGRFLAASRLRRPRPPASAGCAAPRTAASAGATPCRPVWCGYSAGCEDTDDLVADVLALAAARASVSILDANHTCAPRCYGLIWKQGGGRVKHRRPNPTGPTPSQGDALGVTPDPGVTPTGSRVLLLNATFEPLAVVTAKRAVVLMLTGKAECVEAALDGAPSTRRCLTIPAPSVMRLSRYVRVPYRRAGADDPGRGAAPRRPPLRLLQPPRRHHRPRRSPQPRRHPQLGELRRGLPAVQLPQGRPAARRAGLVAAHEADRAAPRRPGGIMVLAVEPLPAWEPWLGMAA